ncbi:MAG TPA: hypothetical protein VGM89_12650 [Puia sp.]|jgi:hypothetical protein
MANVSCILDENVHRTVEFNSPLHVPGSPVSLVLRKLTAPDPRFPEGHYMEITIGGAVKQLGCAGIKMPGNRDCRISRKYNGQFKMEIDDKFYRVLVVGKELATTGSGYSLTILRKMDVTTNTLADYFVYSDSTMKNAMVQGGDGTKIPPGVGPEFLAKRVRKIRTAARKTKRTSRVKR